MRVRLNFKRIATRSIVVLISISLGLSPAFGEIIPAKVSTWASTNINKGSIYEILPSSFAGEDMTISATRQEFAQITVLLYEKIKGTTVKASIKNPFIDTKNQGVLKAYSLGIVQGQGNGIFNPNGLLTREQAATMLTRAYTKATGNRLTAFPGVKLFSDNQSISTYARPSIHYMVNKKFVQGTGNNKFTPKGTASREQVLTMTIRMLDEIGSNKAQYIILEARKSLKPEIIIETKESVYKELLSSEFYQNKGIKELHYSFNKNESKLKVTIKYSVYAQILALTENPSKSSAYASNEAKELNISMNNILKEEISEDMSEYEKEQVIHDYMVKNYKYDTGVNANDYEHPSQSVKGLLYDKLGICQGYAETFDLFMKKIGINSQMVWGEALEEKHVWNMVELDGQWYMVDVTWDDPVPDREGVVSHEYFNVTEKKLGLTHKWNKEQYPKALGTQYKYVK